ncbi:endocuticle structural glycoprotein ABD-5-like [Manduca sexta]|uniref:endocuticle structural glycoprotein ABD-5-like n=1 Tax=Manduca sexta TaxID=7130 RepID=UPI00188FC5A6|nr:endocuticle structural glycoprotein ABD-5-like [Manduca sexta]
MIFRSTELPGSAGVVRSAPADSGVRELPALRHEEVHDEFGQYALRYITAENTVVSERGRLVPSSNGGYVLEIEGRYQFVGDDGKMYVTAYKGGPGGFHVDGQHLPQPVPVPPVAL